MTKLNDHRAAFRLRGVIWASMLIIAQAATTAGNPIDSLRARSDSLSQAGDYRAAHNASVQIMERTGATAGARSLDYADECVDVGTLRFHLGLLGEADEVLRAALEIYRDSVSSNNLQLGICLDRLGTVTHYRGLNQEALPLLEEAIAIFESSGADTALAGVLNNYSLVTRLLQKTDESMNAARRALKILMRETPDHLGIPFILNNLANLHVDQGDYAIGEALYRESIARRRTLFGEDHPQVATALSNLAHVLRLHKNETEAEVLLREAWTIRKGVNEKHPDVGRSMMNLANCLREQQRFDEAAGLLDRALKIHEETLGEDHPSYARNLGYMGDLHFSMKDFAVARENFEKALALNRKVLSPDHPHIASNLMMIARCADGLGDPLADSLYLAGAAAWEEGVGVNHKNAVTARINHARYLLRTGRPKEALDLLERAVPGYESARLRLQPGPGRSRFIESPYRWLTEAHLILGNVGEAWDAWEHASGRIFFDLLYEADGFPWIEDERNELARRNDLWDALETRAATLERAVEKDETLRASRAKAVSELYQAEADYLTYRNQLAEKYEKAEGKHFTWPEIQSRLPRDVALIGWIDSDAVEDAGTSWATVLRSEGLPVWQELNRAETETGIPVARAWSDLLACAGQWPFRVTDTRRADNLARAVWEERFEPIKHLLEGVRHLVVLSGSGMARVPFEALPDGAGALLGDRYTVSYAASATTYLALGGRNPTGGEGVLLVGAPMLHPEDEGDLALTSRSADLLPRALAGDRSAIQALPSLPASRREIDSILKTVGSGRALAGETASEWRLREMAAGDALRDFRWIHFATHTLIDDEKSDGSLMVLSQSDLDDPLEAAIAGTTCVDGLLTAREIIRDWKLDADLVSLSSCQSALGVASPGDGFLGLTQAFCYSGARSVVVSLWSVDDEASSILMPQFYKNLTEGLPKSKALWNAKRTLRDLVVDGEQPYRHPAYWSAFVLHGAP